MGLGVAVPNTCSPTQPVGVWSFMRALSALATREAVLPGCLSVPVRVPSSHGQYFKLAYI